MAIALFCISVLLLMIYTFIHVLIHFPKHYMFIAHTWNTMCHL